MKKYKLFINDGEGLEQEMEMELLGYHACKRKRAKKKKIPAKRLVQYFINFIKNFK